MRCRAVTTDADRDIPGVQGQDIMAASKLHLQGQLIGVGKDKVEPGHSQLGWCKLCESVDRS